MWTRSMATGVSVWLGGLASTVIKVSNRILIILKSNIYVASLHNHEQCKVVYKLSLKIYQMYNLINNFETTKHY